MVDVTYLLLTLVVMLFVAAGLTLATGIYTEILGERLSVYLKKYKHVRWVYLHTPFYIDSFKWFSYIFNDLDARDKNILKYKIKLRNWTKLFVGSAVSGAIIMIFIILLAWYFGA